MDNASFNAVGVDAANYTIVRRYTFPAGGTSSRTRGSIVVQ
jgi:hypothetical protein